MLIRFSSLLLASQLLITVADGVPKYNIQRGCKVDDTPSNMNIGLDETTKSCINDEQAALAQLQAQWSGFAPADRALCSKNENIVSDVPPSYVELLTCLQGQQIVKKMNK
jgi:hypothetical protein